MGKEKLLVTDDDQSIREMLSDMIEVIGYECRVASNAEEALKLLREDDFSIIISDIKMPEIDGISLTKMIKEQSSLSKREMRADLLTPALLTASEAMQIISWQSKLDNLCSLLVIFLFSICSINSRELFNGS